MQLGFHLREMAALVMPVRLFNVLRQEAKMKEPWPEFFLSIFVAVTLSAEYLFLGRASWIYDYGAGLEVLPTYLSLIRSGSNFALWQPAIAGGLDRFAFWGTGDSPINLELILFSIFDPWIANGIHVVLSSVMPVSNYGRDRDGNALDVRLKRPPEKILALNVRIKKYAEENGHVYLDYFSAMVDEHGLLKKELSEDGLHPNSAGYAVMAPLAEQAIQATLAGKASK